MHFHGLIQTFPKYIKNFIVAFIVVLSIGYGSGLLFVGQTNSHHPQGMEENYLGNEENEDAPVMKFKKGEREMLTILHTHVLSISFIFFLLGGLVAMTSLKPSRKAFLMIEPFFSIIITFGGIYLLWKGMLWMKWVVMFSGIVMTMVFLASVFVILHEIYFRKK